MFQGIINALGGVGKILTWFITTVVIPITIWFTILKVEVENTQGQVLELKNRLQKDEDNIGLSFNVLNAKLDQIHKDLGQVMGELRRIK